MKHTEERRERRLLKLLYAGTVLLMLLLATITYTNMRHYVQVSRQVRHHNFLLVEMERLMTTLNEQETGARGFLLSGDSTYLEPYHAALARRGSIEDELKRLMVGTAYQPMVDSLFSQVARVTDMHRLLVLNGSLGVRSRVADAERLQLGKSTMDHMRGLHVQLTEAIQKERSHLLATLENDHIGSPAMMAAYSLLAIVAITMLFVRLTGALHRTERAKEELRDQLINLDQETRARSAAQQLLQQVLDTSPAGIMTFTAVRDEMGRIVDFIWTSSNKAANTMLGRQDLVGERLLREMPENKDHGLFDQYVEVVESGQATRRELHYTGEGLDLWISNHSVKLDDGFLVVFADVTEQKRAQAATMERDRFELIGQITRTVAHEVRNPLTNIQLALEELQDELGAEAVTHNDLLEVIDRNLIRIGTLVKDMLESTRKHDVNLVACDLNNVAARALEKIRDRLDLLGMRAASHLAETPLVQGDPELLVLAITNLLVNAVEAMEPGKGLLSIRTRTEDRSVILMVQDNGKGMTPEVLNKLFDPFFSARRGGLGLGLTTSRSILRAHGVHIDVRSAVGEGSSFVLKFPMT